MKTVPFPDREPPYVVDAKGILDSKGLPDANFLALWESIIVDQAVKDRAARASGPILHPTTETQARRSSLPRRHLARRTAWNRENVFGARFGGADGRGSQRARQVPIPGG